MKTMKKFDGKKPFQLMIKVKSKVRQGQVMRVSKEGKLIIPCEWVQVDEISLGSIKKANKSIVEFRFIPIVDEEIEGEIE